MSNIRFVRKDGQSVDMAIIRKRFFESAPDRASRIWNHAMFGDPFALRVIEELCEIEIVAADAGFGFLE